MIRPIRTAMILCAALLFLTSCTDTNTGAGIGPRDISRSTSSTATGTDTQRAMRSPSGAPASNGPACESRKPASAARQAVVWFYCGPRLEPAMRPVPTRNVEQFLVDELIDGPTARERASGFEGSFNSQWAASAHVSRSPGRVVVNFAPRPPAQRFLASSFFLIQPIQRTLRSLPNVRSAVVLYDGKSLCQLADDC